MADLTADKRKSMPSKDFAEPGKKAFPLNDHVHQALAIGGATHAYHAGHISAAERDRIQAAARAKLNAHKAKKKDNGPSRFGSLAPQSSGHYMSTPTPVGPEEGGGS